MEAVGRTGGDRLHRRPRDRRDARPQRPAPRPLVRDERRLGRHGLRDRRARRAAREDRPQGAAPAGQALPRRPRPRAGSSRTRRSSARSSRRQPYGRWYAEQAVAARRPARAGAAGAAPRETLRKRQLAFGYAQEDMNVILAPLARNAEEPVGSMGNDTSLAVLSDRKPLLYSYFKQLFAQVTNPPIDSIREAVVMSVQASVGSERNLLDETPEHARQLVIDNPILLDSELEQLRQVRSGDLQVAHARHHVARRRGAAGMERALAARLRRGGRGARRRREHPHPLRPRRRARPRAHPLAARRLGGPPPPRPRGHAPPGGPRPRVGRGAQRAQRRHARRLRRRRGQPVPDARDARRARRPRRACPRG